MESACTKVMKALAEAGISLENSTKTLRMAFIDARIDERSTSEVLTQILRSASVYKHGMLPLVMNLVERIRKFCDNFTMLSFRDFKIIIYKVVEEAKSNKSCANIAKNLHVDMLKELNDFKAQIVERYSEHEGGGVQGKKAWWRRLLIPHRKDNLLCAAVSTVISIATWGLQKIIRNLGSHGDGAPTTITAPTANSTMINANITTSPRRLLLGSAAEGHAKGTSLVVVMFVTSWMVCSFISNKVRTSRSNSGGSSFQAMRSSQVEKERQMLEALVEGMQSFSMAMVCVSDFFTAAADELETSASVDVLLHENFKAMQKMAQAVQKAAETFHRHCISAETDIMSVEESPLTQDPRALDFLKLRE